MIIDNHTCSICGSKDDLNVHHFGYGNLGNEDVENDLVTLCHKCHVMIHRIVEHTKENANCPERPFYADWVRTYIQKIAAVHAWNAATINGGYIKVFDAGMGTARKILRFSEFTFWGTSDMREIRSKGYEWGSSLHLLEAMRAGKIVSIYNKGGYKAVQEEMGINSTKAYKILEKFGFTLGEKYQ